MFYIGKNDSLANRGKELWSGQWSSGNITVSGLRNYCLFAVNFINNATRMVGFMPNGKTQFRCFALVASNTSNTLIRRYVFEATATSGTSNTLTYVSGVYFQSANETAVSESNAIVNEIWGII